MNLPWNQEMRRARGASMCPEISEVRGAGSLILIARSAPDRRAKSLARYTPAHLVTDHGKQFTAHMFRQAVRSLGIRPRYGAVHRHGSIAVIERWWKSMKVEYARGLHLFRPLRAIEAKLRAYARWFNEERPHQGLGQRTPDEVHFGNVTSARAVALRAELVAERIDGDRELPVLRLRRAA